MLKKLLVISACLMLTACKPHGVTSEQVKPANADFYKELPSVSPLRGKIGLGEITSYYPEDTAALLIDVDRVSPESYTSALTRMLGEAHLLSKEKPHYILSARIMDKQYPSSGMMHVTAGVAILYRLVEVGTQRVIFSKTLTSTYEVTFMFLGDPNQPRHQAVGMAFGENAAQLIRELSKLNLDNKDPDTSTMPIRRLKGAL